jgi:hypothetical protein
MKLFAFNIRRFRFDTKIFLTLIVVKMNSR